MHSDLCVPSCSAVEDCTITVSSSNNSSNCNSSSCIKRTRSDSDCTKFISIDSESEWEDENDANYDSNGKIARLQNVEEQMKLGKCSEVPNENGTRVTYEESSTELFPFPSSNGSDGMNTCLTKILPSKGFSNNNHKIRELEDESEKNKIQSEPIVSQTVVRRVTRRKRALPERGSEEWKQQRKVEASNRTKRAANRHRCPYCSYTAAFPSKVKRHMENKHSGLHQCSVCNVKFDQYTDLRAHIAKQHPKKEHQCEYCDYTSSVSLVLISSTNLIDLEYIKSHLLKVHSKNFPAYPSLKTHARYSSGTLLYSLLSINLYILAFLVIYNLTFCLKICVSAKLPLQIGFLIITSLITTKSCARADHSVCSLQTQSDTVTTTTTTTELDESLISDSECQLLERERKWVNFIIFTSIEILVIWMTAEHHIAVNNATSHFLRVVASQYIYRNIIKRAYVTTHRLVIFFLLINLMLIKRNASHYKSKNNYTDPLSHLYACSIYYNVVTVITVVQHNIYFNA
uniref:C2H2-type domain-containing protein n=1 Tax=Heterorhabditis bacteriophora TaxID=37862 RepID=A0A1I7WIU6_HETBA